MNRASGTGDRHRSRSTRHSRKARPSWLAGALGVASFATGLALALHYPLGPAAATGAFLVLVAAALASPRAWLVGLPALLPVTGLALWTGWLSFEEMDLLVLAAAAGGYTRMLWRGGAPGRPPGSGGGALALVALVVAAFAASVLLAMWRGFEDAGGFAFGWFQGYHEPMNSLRLAKSFLWALLLLPLWQRAHAKAPGDAAKDLADGLALGLAAASLATIWERAAFTDLLNFSSDYRTTAMFWEMHVGGAALDGFLALTVPFAVWGLGHARSVPRWIGMVLVAALAGYACLTTFSRGVYLAIPVGLALQFALQSLQRPPAPTGTAGTPGPSGNPPAAAAPQALLRAGLLMLVFGVGAAWLFPTSGYRGLLASWAAMLLLLALPAALNYLRASLGHLVVGLAGGLLLAGLAWLAAWLLPKGAYLAFGASCALAAAPLALLRQPKAGRRRLQAAWALAGFISVLAGLVLVADHWGGTAAWQAALPAAAVLLVLGLVAGLRQTPPWPGRLRWQGATAAGMALLAGMVGVFSGGGYMTERFSTGEQDLQGRLRHWEQGLAMLHTPADWAFGKGLGRYPSSNFFAAPAGERTGDYRLAEEAGNPYLVLTGGQHVNGWGEILRVSQRVALPARPVTFTARVRTAETIALQVEICEKHLLYNANCLLSAQQVTAKPGEWQKIELELKGDALSHGAWYAPRLLVFSIGLETRGGTAQLDDLALTDAHERSLLANGDFSEQLAHWMSSSDRHHMPWHMKSMLLHVLFDQGVVGLLLWLAITGGALWRLCLGRARQHPLAPPIAAALVGFGIVGLFDSLLDVPRDAMLYYLLVLIGLTLVPPTARPRSSRHAGGETVPPSEPPSHPVPSSAAPLAAAVVLGLAAWSVAPPADAQPVAQAASAQRLQVGPKRAVKTLAEAARTVRAGAVVEVDAGEYRGDVAVWLRDDVTVRAVGGRVRLLADGAAAEGKGIWVVRARRMRVEGFDFEGAQVPSRNGAGIRFEKGSLWVRDCRFLHNEMGLLTNNEADAELTVENSEFAHNQRPDGHNHNLYVGQIGYLSVTGSYFHHARSGHLLKTRAAVNHILYNRLTDEAGGTASYELEFPNGGVAYVVGNVVEQGPQTENVHLVSYGAEGYKWPHNELHLVHNTLVDGLAQGGSFLRVSPAPAGSEVMVHAANNLLVGPGSFPAQAGPVGAQGNLTAGWQDFADAAAHDFRLRPDSPLRGRAVDPGRAAGGNLRPDREYLPPRGTRALAAPAHNPGALQTPAALPGAP